MIPGLLLLGLVQVPAAPGSAPASWLALGAGAWPSAALGSDGSIHVAYVRGGAPYHARLGALVLEDPVRVGKEPMACMGMHERAPRIAVGKDRRIHVAWCEAAAGHALHVTTSDDSGRSFAHDVVVRDLTEGGGEALGDVACDAAGTIYVAWVDSRTEDGDSPVSAEVYFDVSRDGGRSFGRDREATVKNPTRCCPCCRPTLLPATPPLLALRGGEKNLRDVFFLPLAQPLPAGICPVADRWVFAGCPMDAPAIAGAPEAALAVAWKTKDGVQVALRERRDGPFTTRKIPRAAHPALAVDGKGRITLAWQTGDDTIQVAALQRAGNELTLRELRLPPQRARFPHLVLDQGQRPVLLATAEGGIVGLRL
jgi:hypothetical protein